MAEPKPEGIQLPIEWHIPEGLISRYATNIVAQHTDHEFIISFFDSPPPPVTGTSEEQKAQFEKLGSVRAECVARIIVAAERMERFVDVLQANLESYKTMKGQE